MADAYELHLCDSRLNPNMFPHFNGKNREKKWGKGGVSVRKIHG